MTQKEIYEMLASHALWLEDRTQGKCADFNHANLRLAHLEGADLCEAHLEGADLYAAHLEGANLRLAYLERADLYKAHLEGANLDFTSLSLSCKGLGWYIDKRIAAQLAYHFCSMKCTDWQVIAAQNALIGLANESHLIGDHNLDKLEQKSIDEYQ
jgi:hypothetical protein